MKIQLHQLKLVYPPITNQEAEWLRTSDEAGVRERLERSNLYMIAQRAEAKFVDVDFDQKEFCIQANYSVPGLPPSPFRVDLREAALRTASGEVANIEAGDKLIRSSILDDADEMREVLDWFTAEKILYDRWRGHPAVHGLNDYRSFATYDLLYVGISQEEGSFTRLVDHAHEKRVRILSNERPRAPNARVSDELIFFFFDVEPLRFHMLEDPSNAEEMLEMLAPNMDKRRMIADAEKAFTRVLRSQYNTIKYDRYPRGSDGLYDQGIDRYSFVIDEDITLKTSTATIRGAYGVYGLGADGRLPGPESPRVADAIFVEGDSVELVSYETMAGLAPPSPSSQ